MNIETEELQVTITTINVGPKKLGASMVRQLPERGRVFRDGTNTALAGPLWGYVDHPQLGSLFLLEVRGTLYRVPRDTDWQKVTDGKALPHSIPAIDDMEQGDCDESRKLTPMERAARVQVMEDENATAAVDLQAAADKFIKENVAIAPQIFV
jgi:hypothetical protein